MPSVPPESAGIGCISILSELTQRRLRRGHTVGLPDGTEDTKLLYIRYKQAFSEFPYPEETL